MVYLEKLKNDIQINVNNILSSSTLVVLLLFIFCYCGEPILTLALRPPPPQTVRKGKEIKIPRAVGVPTPPVTSTGDSFGMSRIEHV